MTEKGKKPGGEAAGESDPLSATGMFLNAFAPQPEPSLEQAPESPARGPAKPGQPGEFTQMFQKLEPPPVPPLPQAKSTNSPSQEPGEFTRTFVAAATNPGLRPAPNTPNAAPLAPPSPPRMRGFSAPGISDSASAEGSFTQLFQTPPSHAAPSPIQPHTPLPTAPPHATERAWPQSVDPVPSEDRGTPGGLTQLFRSLSDESAPPPNRFGESPLVNHAAATAQPPASDPASVTMLIQRLTEDLQQAMASGPAIPPPAPPGGLSGPGEFTRIIAAGAAKSAPEPGVAAGNFATPAPPTMVFPAAPVPAFVAPQIPVPPAPAFAPPAPALALPPAQPPKVSPSAPPQQSKLQQMLPMLLVLNAFLVVVLILLVVFALKSR
jgi:hypothetical protein